MPDMDLWEWMAKIGGPLMVILGLFAWSVWKALASVWHHFVLPLRDRLFKHFDNLDAAMTRFAENDSKQTTILERLAGDVTGLQVAIREVGCPVAVKLAEKNGQKGGVHLPTSKEVQS